MNVVGRKNRAAASTHRLIEDVPLRAATAIQRGPSTDATLNSNKSHGPIARRSCFFGSDELGSVTRSHPARESVRLAAENCAERDPATPQAPATRRRMPRGHPEEISRGRRVSCPDAYRA